MDWRIVYDSFPVNQKLIWLNNCGTTPAGTHVEQAMASFMRGYAEKGVLTDAASYAEIKQRIKAILSGLLGCAPDELALIHHTAEGMNIISHGLSLAPGDEIVLLEDEYPSNVYPWLHWRDKGVDVVTTPLGSSPAVFLKEFKQRLTARTRVVALSAVHWCTGMPLPINDVGAVCQQRNISFVVDGAQGVGMQPIDVKRAGIDYMAFSAWKWLLGPLGLGVLYVSEHKLNDLKVMLFGTESVVDDQQYLPYKSELKPNADRFAYSTANFNDWVYFAASLEFLNNIGFERVRTRIFELAAHLTGGLKKSGFQVLSDNFGSPPKPSGIVVCEKPGHSASKAVSYLRQHNVVAAERLKRIRLAPHIYLSFQQLEQAIGLLNQACR